MNHFTENMLMNEVTIILDIFGSFMKYIIMSDEGVNLDTSVFGGYIG